MNKNERIIIDLMYREMFKKMCIFAKKQLGDSSLAEEAVQETFRIACEKEPRVLMSENPRGWMMATLKYTISNMKREREYLGKMLQQLHLQEAALETPEENVDILYSDLVCKADFDMLKMIVLEKYTIKDAAEYYGISVNACKKRISRIKQRLKNILEEEEGGDTDD